MRKVFVFLVSIFLCGCTIAPVNVATSMEIISPQKEDDDENEALATYHVTDKTAEALMSSAVYHVTDTVDKNKNRMEGWTRYVLSVNDEGEPQSHKLVKKWLKKIFRQKYFL